MVNDETEVSKPKTDVAGIAALALSGAALILVGRGVE
jgi:hypothetical protein